MTTLRTTVRIGDLLDFSSPLVSSISPENEPLQPKGTVHHRPPHYTGPTKNNTNKKEMKIQQVKVEKKAEIEKCPNVLFRNGVICTPYRTPMKKGERPSDLKSELERRRNYRKVMMRRGRSTEEERKREKTHMSETRSNEGSLQLPCPQVLDTKSRNQFVSRLLIARKILKLHLKDRSMAVNLESLLPQVFQGNMVPSDDLLFNEHLSLSSMYQNDSVLGDLTDSALEFSFSKPDSLPLDVSDSVEYFGNDFPEQASQSSPSSDFFGDTWLTTSMVLPLTPEETLDDTCYTQAFNSETPSPTSTFVATPTNYPHHIPLSDVPLTPESLPSPLSSSNSSEDLNEVLSYFNDNSPYSDFDCTTGEPPVSISPLATTPLTSCSDGPSIYSSYAFMGSPTSSSPSTPVTLTTVTPNDTIRGLLARESDSMFSSQQPFQGVQDTSANSPAAKSTSQCSVNPRKRNASDTGLSSKAPESKSRVFRSRKHINPTGKKERKREQNKSAALRYRQKKKEEKSEIEILEQNLEEKNVGLKATVKSLEAEINYLKKLWFEIEDKRQKSI